MNNKLNAIQSLGKLIIPFILINFSTCTQASLHYDAKTDTITLSELQVAVAKSGKWILISAKDASNLKTAINKDPLVSNYYDAIKLSAQQILQKPPLTRKMVGNRLLATSREFLDRMSALGPVFFIEKDRKMLNKIEQELQAVCSFSDWHPSHLLDVAEMSVGVVEALNWAGDAMSAQTKAIAKQALIEKALLPSFEETQNQSIFSETTNRNQVCNAGLIAAAIATTDINPDLALRAITRSLKGIPAALKDYAPDGVYAEGPTYWGYGTSFTALTIDMLENVFQKDYGISSMPGFMKSPDFWLTSIGPSGLYFNFSDSKDRPDEGVQVTLLWFAQRLESATYLQKNELNLDPAKIGEMSRLSGLGLVWLSKVKPISQQKLPLNWFGDGINPVVIFRDSSSTKGYYLGCKGGRASINHGNMDAGSFVFDLNGERWIIDPGNQDYNKLEQLGFDIWNRKQESQRWTLITKNNFGHSTLTIDSQYFNVDGYASVQAFNDEVLPSASIDLHKIYFGKLEKAVRTFKMESSKSLLITDEIKAAKNVNDITFALMTTAKAKIVANGVTLSKNGKDLHIQVVQPTDAVISVVSYDPPPSEYDLKIKNLKRIEIKLPSGLKAGKSQQIRVRLSSD